MSEQQPLLLTYRCPPLAYRLSERGVCWRQGGERVCGDCIKDRYGPVLGFRRAERLSVRDGNA